MPRINLLPWREGLRRERQREFLMSLLMTGVLGVVLVFLLGLAYGQRIQNQQFRNDLISSEIRLVQLRIERINELEKVRSRLISRKQIIEQLQASRSMTVELLDKLARSIPMGVTLVSVAQLGSSLSLAGTSQSNARVSAYLRALEKSDLFLVPDLEYVRSADIPSVTTEPYDFSIGVTLRPPRTATEELDLYDLESQEADQ